MERCGVRFQPSLTGTLNLSRTNAFFLGGGKALVNAYYAAAARLGVHVLYDTEVTEIALDDGFVRKLTVTSKGFPLEVRAKVVIASSGGFQANIEWLKQGWGEAAENFLIRGTPYAKGGVLKSLLSQGVASVGDPTQCHAVAIDGRAPKFDGGIATRLDCVPFSIVVNKHGQRFYDEGQDVWPKRYAIWGRLVAQQPDQIAYSIIDSRSERLFMPSVFPAIKAATIGELAVKLGLDPAALEAHGGAVQRRPASPARSTAAAGRRAHRRAGPAQDQLGAPDRRAAVHRLPAAARHHLHLSGREGERAGAGDHGGRAARREPVRLGRDHGGQYPRQGLPRRVRNGDRHRVRPHRRDRRRRNVPIN